MRSAWESIFDLDQTRRFFLDRSAEIRFGRKPAAALGHEQLWAGQTGNGPLCAGSTVEAGAMGGNGPSCPDTTARTLSPPHGHVAVGGGVNHSKAATRRRPRQRPVMALCDVREQEGADALASRLLAVGRQGEEDRVVLQTVQQKRFHRLRDALESN